MAADFLSNLLADLGRALKMTLTPDQNNSCLLNMADGIKVQMEMAPNKKNFIIGCKIGEVPIGPFRENVFREALRSNGTRPPHAGTFAFSEKKDCLILMRMMPVEGLTGDKISDALKPFVEKATRWQSEIHQGRVPDGTEGDDNRGGGGSSSGNIFGLMR